MPERVHPKADIFPMMSEAELQVMANDIKENGLKDKIPRGKWQEDGEEVEGIIDGRNRLKACEIAGVNPEFYVFMGDEKAIIAYINTSNLTRRHLTKGQQAMAYAMLYPEPKIGRPVIGNKKVEPLNLFYDKALVSRARKVLNHSTTLAQQVMYDVPPLSLDRALDKVNADELQSKRDTEARAILEKDYPELLEEYTANRMSLEEAKTEAERRTKVAKEEEERIQREAERHKQGLIEQYDQGFSGLKTSLEAAAKLARGIYRAIPEWLDDEQAIHDTNTAYEIFSKYFPRGYQEFQESVNLLEATTRNISEIRQALLTYERNRRPAPEVVPLKPGPRPVR